MSKVTELSSSNEAAIIHRILRRVNRAIDNNFESVAPSKKSSFAFAEGEETALNPLNKDEGVKLPPPPNHLPFLNNDNPKHSTYAVSQHEPESLYTDLHSAVTSEPHQPTSFIQSDHTHSTMDVSQFLDMGGFKESKFARRKTLLAIILIAIGIFIGFYLSKKIPVVSPKKSSVQEFK